ncbi:MAG: hypothetical protein Q7S00_06395 [bacterium]|nr:hypothetical protein [bacterium]
MSLSVYNLLHQTVELTAGERNTALVGDKRLSIQEWTVVIGDKPPENWEEDVNRFLGEALVHPQWIFDAKVLDFLADQDVNTDAVEEIQERQKYGEEAERIAGVLTQAMGGDKVFEESEWEGRAGELKKVWDEGGRFGIALFLDKMAEGGEATLAPDLRTRIQERLVNEGYLRQELLDAVGAKKTPPIPDELFFEKEPSRTIAAPPQALLQDETVVLPHRTTPMPSAALRRAVMDFAREMQRILGVVAASWKGRASSVQIIFQKDGSASLSFERGLPEGVKDRFVESLSQNQDYQAVVRSFSSWAGGDLTGFFDLFLPE